MYVKTFWSALRLDDAAFCFLRYQRKQQQLSSGKLRLLTLCDRSGRKGIVRGGKKARTGSLHFRLLMCGSELRRWVKREKGRDLGWREKEERHNERVTVEEKKGGGREKTWAKKVMRESV